VYEIINFGRYDRRDEHKNSFISHFLLSFSEKEVITDYVFELSDETNDVTNETEKQSTNNSSVRSERIVLTEESLAVNEESGSYILRPSSYLIISMCMWRLVMPFLAVY
jgi:hypothetical protein